MIRLLVAAVAVAAVCAMAAPPAQAHHGKVAGVPIHQLWDKITGKNKDPVPRPAINCGWNNRGQIVDIWDPILKAFVKWECRCPWGKYGKCAWFRLKITHSNLPWDQMTKRWVWDWHRWPGCTAIVCLAKRKVKHFYPTLYAQGGRLL